MGEDNVEEEVKIKKKKKKRHSTWKYYVIGAH